MIPCNVDIATQDVLQLAKEVDPDGIRTMGVLTKPDLATESTTQQAVIDLVLGKRNDLQLGYYVVQNRGPNDNDTSPSAQLMRENATFGKGLWCTIAGTGRTGIDALRKGLRALLMDISKREFPKVRTEISKRLLHSEMALDGMGSSRAETSAQREYLTKIAAQFQAITRDVLVANYSNGPIFEKQPSMKLITRIIGLTRSLPRRS